MPQASTWLWRASHCDMLCLAASDGGIIVFSHTLFICNVNIDIIYYNSTCLYLSPVIIHILHIIFIFPILKTTLEERCKIKSKSDAYFSDTVPTMKKALQTNEDNAFKWAGKLLQHCPKLIYTKVSAMWEIRLRNAYFLLIYAFLIRSYFLKMELQ